LLVFSFQGRGHKKSGLLGPLGLERKLRGLFDSFFAEAGADGGSLAGLELGVRLADDVNGAFAFDDLAVSVAAFGGGE
jgi:hypothetical protein